MIFDRTKLPEKIADSGVSFPSAGLTVKAKHSWLIPKVVHSVKHNMGSETRGKPIRQNLY